MRLHPWMALFRAGNSFTAGIFGVLLGAILATRGLPEGDYALVTIFHSISVMTFMSSWNALNDLMDIEIDSFNRPERPIPSGEIPVKHAKIGIFLMGASSLFSIFLAGYISWSGEIGIDSWIPALVIWVVALALLFHYESPSKFSLKMKDKGLPGNFAISLSVGLVFIFGAAGVSEPLDPRAWAVFFVGFFYNLSREIVKDVEDLGGDKGRNTYAISRGPEKARFLAWIVLIIGLISLLFPFVPSIGIFTDWHVAFVIPAVVTLLLVKPKLFAAEDRAAQKMIKRSMQLCLVAFLVISIIPL